MKSISILIVAMISVLMIISCNDNPVDSLTDTSFYPLNLGNKWTYNTTGYDSIGTIISQGEFSESLPSEYIWNKRFIYEFNTPFWFVHNDMLYLQNKIYGLYLVIGSPDGAYLGEEFLQYKYPVVEGEYFLRGWSRLDTTYVICTDSIVDCEAGIFKCIVYKNYSIDYSDFPIIRVFDYTLDYVSYGTGKIKKEYYFPKSDGEF